MYVLGYLQGSDNGWVVTIADMQKESWNTHLTKILICSHMLNGTDW
jgi:hypothetical protein